MIPLFMILKKFFHSVSQLVSQSVSQPAIHSLIHSLTPSLIYSFSQSVRPFVGLSASQPTSPLASQPKASQRFIPFTYTYTYTYTYSFRVRQNL